MKRKIGISSAAVLVALSLSSCAYLRNPGPCYGVGCRAFAPAQGQVRATAQFQKTGNPNVPATPANTVIHNEQGN